MPCWIAGTSSTADDPCAWPLRETAVELADGGLLCAESSVGAWGPERENHARQEAVRRLLPGGWSRFLDLRLDRGLSGRFHQTARLRHVRVVARRGPRPQRRTTLRPAGKYL